MEKEKIEQNIERTYNHLREWFFYTLGCTNEEAQKILKGVIKKLK